MKYFNMLADDGWRYLCVRDVCGKVYILGRTGQRGWCQDLSTMRLVLSN